VITHRSDFLHSLGRFPPYGVQDECSFWTLGESADPDPIASIMNFDANVRS
jgi:hypothetical protein